MVFDILEASTHFHSFWNSTILSNLSFSTYYWTKTILKSVKVRVFFGVKYKKFRLFWSQNVFNFFRLIYHKVFSPRTLLKYIFLLKFLFIYRNTFFKDFVWTCFVPCWSTESLHNFYFYIFARKQILKINFVGFFICSPVCGFCSKLFL